MEPKKGRNPIEGTQLESDAPAGTKRHAHPALLSLPCAPAPDAVAAMSHAPEPRTPEQQKRRAAARARKFWLLRTFVVGPGVALLKLLMATWRVRTTPADAWSHWSPTHPAPEVLALVHGSLFVAMAGYRRLTPRPRRPLAILISPSQDGLLLGDVVRRFGMTVVTGSTKKRAAASVLEMMDVVQAGTVAVFAVDGPRGPRCVPKAGAILLARQAGARLRFMTTTARWALRLPGWDRALLPLPFARVDIRAIDLDPAELLPDSDFAAAARRFQERLLAEMAADGEPIGDVQRLSSSSTPPPTEDTDAHHRG